jgi:hypothetical protein
LPKLGRGFRQQYPNDDLGMYAGILDVVWRYAPQVDEVKEQTLQDIETMLQEGHADLVIKRMQQLALLPDLPQPSQSSSSGSSRGIDATVRHLPLLTTGYFINVGEAKKVRAAVMLGAAAALAFQSSTIGAFTTAAAAIWNNIKRMTDEELEVIRIMQRLTEGKIYTTWLPTQLLVHAIPAENPDIDVIYTGHILENMVKRGILREVNGKWQVVR